METLTIDARFNGPDGSANGGYTCGRIAGLLEFAVSYAPSWRARATWIAPT
jgi:hypothetical protein